MAKIPLPPEQPREAAGRSLLESVAAVGQLCAPRTAQQRSMHSARQARCTVALTCSWALTSRCPPRCCGSASRATACAAPGARSPTCGDKRCPSFFKGRCLGERTHKTSVPNQQKLCPRIAKQNYKCGALTGMPSSRRRPGGGPGAPPGRGSRRSGTYCWLSRCRACQDRAGGAEREVGLQTATCLEQSGHA